MIRPGIRHDNIVPILEVNQAAGRLLLVMPFVDGESLRSRLRRDGRLGLSGIVAIARQIADALGRADAEGALYKDVKPENIFLTGPHALLMELGVARAVRPRRRRDRRPGSIPGDRHRDRDHVRVLVSPNDHRSRHTVIVA